MAFESNGLNLPEVEPETEEEREINNKIDAWHMGSAGTDKELHEFLGWTWQEYKTWVEAGVVPSD